MMRESATDEILLLCLYLIGQEKTGENVRNLMESSTKSNENKVESRFTSACSVIVAMMGLTGIESNGSLDILPFRHCGLASVLSNWTQHPNTIK